MSTPPLQQAQTHHEVVDVTSASARPCVLIVVANPTTSTTTGWPVGFWAAELLRKRGANYIQAGLFKAFAVPDQNLITGQQQYSSEKVARLVIEALGD